jgi:hypothetical protein
MTRPSLRKSVLLAVILGLPTVAWAGPKTPAPPSGTSTNTPSIESPSFEIPASVFQVPSTPREGRDPFFPNSQLNAPVVKPKEAPLDFSGFVLNGITSPPKRTAMINGRTFEVGESGEIKLPNGTKSLIKCIDIKGESVVIDVNGQRLELRMRFGL